MKKVLLHKFGTSPPRDENPLLKLRRPVFKSKSRTFKSLSISSRDIAGVGALLALSPTCAVAAANRKKGKAGRGGGAPTPILPPPLMNRDNTHARTPRWLTYPRPRSFRPSTKSRSGR